ncbi:MAG: hypothetical protein O3A19_05230 [Planctomycetota bacterium]|nr:hypothetical protein [Planctomycetota bacterium]
MTTMAHFPRRPILAIVTMLLIAGCRTMPAQPAPSDQTSNSVPPSHHVVVVVVVEDCPGAAPTAHLIRSVAAAMGIAAVDVQTIVVRTPEEAAANQMLGSPTVLIGGMDIEPRARARTDYAIACRLYGGRSVPPSSLVEAAIREAWTKQ